MDRVGRQPPTVSVILPYTETRGPEAIELFNSSEKSILPWQDALTYDIMAVDSDGLWIHQKFGYSVPRRNGKSEIALARCIWGLKNGERSSTRTQPERQISMAAGRSERSSTRAQQGEHRAFHLGASEHFYKGLKMEDDKMKKRSDGDTSGVKDHHCGRGSEATGGTSGVKDHHCGRGREATGGRGRQKVTHAAKKRSDGDA